MSVVYSNKKKASISNFWRTVTFVCGSCENEAVLDTASINTRLYYKCDAHNFMIPAYEVENAVNKMAAMIVEEAEDGCAINLTNFRWEQRDKATNRTYVFRVKEHKNSKIRVAVSEKS